MKINLYDLFDAADVDDLCNLSSESLVTEPDNELSKRIVTKVSEQVKKPKRISKIIALVAITAIFISSVSVFGATYFKPNIDERTIIEIMEGVDLNSVGKELNISSTENGLTFVLNRVLSDNSRMLLYFICPEYKGYTASPTGIDVYVNGEKVRTISVSIGTAGANIGRVCISDLENIKDDMDIKITFSGFSYVNDKGWVKNKFAFFNLWSFEFKSFGNGIKKELVAEPFEYKNEIIKPTDFIISPLGLNFDCVLKNEDVINLNNISIEIEMKDGTVFSEQKGIMPCIAYFGYEDIIEYKISGEFETILDIDEIKTIKVFDSIIYFQN